MTTTNHDDTEVNPFDSLTVEGFMLSDGKNATRHFEQDPDLDAKTRKALGGGTHHALLLITLGIDAYDCHRVQLDFSPGQYDDGAFDAVSEAIGALEVMRHQLGVMASTAHAREAEHNAFLLGVEAERAGLPVKGRRASLTRDATHSALGTGGVPRAVGCCVGVVTADREACRLHGW